MELKVTITKKGAIFEGKVPKVHEVQKGHEVQNGHQVSIHGSPVQKGHEVQRGVVAPQHAVRGSRRKAPK